MKRTTIRLEDGLFSETKQFAARTGKTFQAVVEDALRLMLFRRPMTGTPSAYQSPMERHFGSAPEPDAPALRLVTFGEGGVLPGVDIDDTASLLDLMEGEPRSF